MVKNLTNIILLTGLFFWLVTGSAAQISDFDAESWLEGDDDWEARALSVNEGDLSFIASPTVNPVHHHVNEVTIRKQSLVDGWVLITQCHEHLDSVARAQILFRKGSTRGLKIKSSINIGKIWVEGASIQLADVQKGAKCCIEAETKALHILGNGSYSLRNGPFMRRFLDGYYPMQVTMKVKFPADDLLIANVYPEHQDGFQISETVGMVKYEALFEGQLNSEIFFWSTN